MSAALLERPARDAVPLGELAVAPVAAAVVGLRRCLARPAVLSVGVLLALLLPSSGDEGGGVSVAPADLVAVLLVGVVVLRLLTTGTGLVELRSPVVLLLLGVLVSTGLSTLTADDPATSAAGLVRYAEIFVVGPLAVWLSLRERRDAWLLLGAVALLGCAEGAVGVVQYVTGTGAGYGDETRRAVGTFGGWDIMAMAACVRYALAVLVAVALASSGRTRRWAVVGAVALLPPLLFSLSRGALLAAIVSVAVVVALSGWRAVLAVGGGVVLAVTLALPLVGPTVADRVSSITSTASAPDQSVQDRYALWSAARTMFGEAPLTGIGLKGFAARRDSSSPLDLSTGSDVTDGHGFRRVPLLSPHNTYYLVLAEQGVVGITAFGGLFGGLLVLGLRRLRRTPREDVAHRTFGLAALGLLVSYLCDALYADIGGASTLLITLVLGIAAFWASGARLDAA